MATRLFSQLGRRTGVLVAVVLIITAMLAIPFLAMASTESASTEPAGPVFDARDLIDERLASSVFATIFVAEADGGDLLLAEPLQELHAAAEALRTDAEIGPTLFGYFNADVDSQVHGVVNIADLIDWELRAGGGSLSHATDQQVKAAASILIDRFGASSDTLSLSQGATKNADGEWVAPATFFPVLSDDNKLGFGGVSITLGADTASEQYSRDIQTILRTADGWSIHGVAIDLNLTSEEQGALAGPFIGFTVLAALLLVGSTFRSYWVLAVVSNSFLMLLIWLKGISNLVGFKDDLTLSFIVPIAMISFGVDYAFHSIGRYQEERAAGNTASRAAIAGAAAVSSALVLATLSDSVAFLANVSAGIESVIQFGIAAAIGLFSAYLLLGVVAPFVIARIEASVPAPSVGRRATVGRIGASIAAAMLAMASVLLLVFIAPTLGVVLTAITIVATLFVPLAIRSKSEGTRLGDTAFVASNSSMARRIGAIVSAIASRPRIVLPAAALITAVAVTFAVQVPARFDVEDFFSPDTDFVQGLDRLDAHVGQRDGEQGAIYIEGDLTDPASLARLAAHLDELQASESTVLARADGRIRFAQYGILEIFDETWKSPVMVSIVAEQTGVALTDTNSDRIPDTRAQVEALLGVAEVIGVPIDGSNLALTPAGVAVRFDRFGSAGQGGDATQVVVAVPNSRDQAAVGEARALLDETADAMSGDLRGAFVQATGSPIVREASLDGTNRALLVSLPIAVLACLAVATAFMRSIRYGLASVVPILMVVAWLYAFMEIAGYAINLVTATIAAVSIGIGIDFALHYVVRYREELDRWGQRSVAVRIAGEGTGLALVGSAVSSAVGFCILALAPMPLFAAYGLLTAIMIMMALTATLVVLPSLLVVITRDAHSSSLVDDSNQASSLSAPPAGMATALTPTTT